MEASRLSAAEVRGYLEVLSVAQDRPSLMALRASVRAQMLRIPFETVSKLWYLRRRDLRDVVDLYERPAPHQGERGTSWGKPE